MSDPLDSFWFPGTWLGLSAVSVLWVVRDLRRHNAGLGPAMKLVWVLTAAYAGPIGLAVYYYAGRRQIRRDSLWRRAFRSSAHCYSGCGVGEVVGIILTMGLFAAGQTVTALVTFALAYAAGLLLTVLPLVHDGEPLRRSITDAVVSETGSIVAMEAVAISVDLQLAGRATIGVPRFWSSLLVSLGLGLLAAYPVNVLLIQRGVKAGMHDPRNT